MDEKFHWLPAIQLYPINTQFGDRFLRRASLLILDTDKQIRKIETEHIDSSISMNCFVTKKDSLLSAKKHSSGFWEEKLLKELDSFGFFS